MAETKLNSWLSQEQPRIPTHTQEMSELNHNLCHCTQQVTKEMTQETPSMTVQRKEMNELDQNLCPCNPHMAKEMTKLTR